MTDDNCLQIAAKFIVTDNAPHCADEAQASRSKRLICWNPLASLMIVIAGLVASMGLILGQVSVLSARDLLTPTAPSAFIPVAATTPITGVVVAQSVTPLQSPRNNSGSAGRLRRNQTFTVVGQRKNCEWLKIVSDSGVTGWIKPRPGVVQWRADCMGLTAGTFRPPTRTESGGFPNSGPGALKVVNDGQQDAVVILTTLDRRHMQVSYVRSGETHIASGIPNGNYELYFTIGSDWVGEVFTRDVSRQKFEELFAYDSTHGLPGWEIHLEPIASGNAETVRVSHGKFPAVTIE